MRKQTLTLLTILIVSLANAGNSHTTEGKASFYSGYHITANGERYKKYSDLDKSYTAAHKTLPFGTRVKVTNTQNGRSCVVRINNRGPYVKGRCIDLTRNAAEDLGMIKAGVVPVKLTVLNSTKKD